MAKSSNNHSVDLHAVTSQPTRKSSQSNDPLAKIRPMISKKPQLVPTLPRSNTIQISSSFKMLNTRIQAIDSPSYQPLVTISDNENSDGDEEDFVSPIQKLTKEELREELKIFNQNSRTSLLTNGDNNDDDDDEDVGDLQFRIQQPIKRSICCSSYPFSLKDTSCTIS